MARKSTQKPKRKAPAKRKATDAAQHKRFLETAKKVEASDEPQAFAKAFNCVARSKSLARG